MPESYKRHPNTTCKVCGKSIYRRPAELAKKPEHQVYCSRKCYGVSCRKEEPCVICGKLILAGQNKKTCSRACANTHRTGVQYKLNRPRDKVVSQRRLKVRLLQQRGERCERCVYNKTKILQVHHVDRDRTNNDLSNLELICPNCHAEEHYSK